ncbi:hypothetical protein [Sabulicella glaciei]|uniref:DUF5672 domain-containing protein n=1 Tax=Sabulicella glaciei TaxID=2984948 RepID=A0ABT3NSF9_9PROT|nr:hypothetical protein [Roseococcus sp. MDT2-1-1]MCW8085094.1 hypothetical protein [Roseococcus sp. MDT2-1-1]
MEDFQSQPRVALLLDAHKTDPLVFYQFRTLTEALSPEIAVFLIYHAPKAEFMVRSNIIVLNDEEIFLRQSSLKRGTSQIIPGNPDLKMIRSAELLSEFDYYLRMEFDVLCVSPVRDTIFRTINRFITYDFVGARLVDKQRYPGFFWWNTLSVPESIGTALRPADIWKAFLPLCFCSRSFIESYRDALALGWRGHYEVTMPTIAALAGFKICDFESKWPGMTNDRNFRADKISDPQKLDSEFVHPVKDINLAMEMFGFREMAVACERSRE